MSANAMPLSALVKTHEKCKKCGVLVPTRFLSCPACFGFTKKHERWAPPAKAKAKNQPVQEQSLFDVSEENYPI